jgi:hypothetical protein
MRKDTKSCHLESSWANGFDLFEIDTSRNGYRRGKGDTKFK